MTQLNRQIAPAFNSIKEFKIKGAEKFSLNNGIPVYRIEGGSQDISKIDLLINAGAIYTQDKLTAPMLALMLSEGTKNKTAHQISEAFDFYGAHFQPKAEKDHAFASLVSLNKHLEHTLPLFAEAVNESTFPEKELRNLLQRRKQNFLVDQEKTSFLARELFSSKLFGKEHLYGKATQLEMYDDFKRESLLDFYDRKYHSGNYSIVLSGKVTDALMKQIEGSFGELPIMLTSKHRPDAIDSKPGDYFIEKSEAVQSSIRMGFTTINKYHHDYLGLKILITILGGYFGSRLMKNIREDKGYTYGIHSMLISLQETGYVGIAADVKADFSKETIIEIKKEIELLKNEPVPEEELSLLKNYMMGEMLQMFDGPFATSDSFINAIQYGFGFGYYDRMIDKILTISSDELLMLANTYLNLDNFVTVTVGKK